jgi:DNA gyrase subunit A
MLISDGGTLVRTRASEVAQTGRYAQGVRLIRLSNVVLVVGVVSVDAGEDEELEAIDVVENTEVEAITSEEVSSEPKDDTTDE